MKKAEIVEQRAFGKDLKNITYRRNQDPNKKETRELSKDQKIFKKSYLEKNENENTDLNSNLYPGNKIQVSTKMIIK
jgi:hypothetical protein